MKQKRMFSIISIILLVSVCSICLLGCKPYDPFLPEVEIKMDNSIPLAIGEEINMATNPDSGYRMETYITLGAGTAFPGSDKTHIQHFDEQIKMYQDDKTTEVQLYVYLCEFNTQEISDEAFNELYTTLRKMRDKGYRVLLRFAYENSSSNIKGPTTEQLLKHIAQIKVWMTDNRYLVTDTVMVVQAGMIGLWGEWHSSEYPHNQKVVMDAIINMVPAGVYLQTRMVNFKNNVTASSKVNMVGFHDDYLVGTENEWNITEGYTNNKKYKQMVDQSRYTINDAEMPWGAQYFENGGIIDGKAIIKQAVSRSLATLSLAHNYKEDGVDKPYNLERYKTEMISADDLNKIKAPYNPNYFIGTDGLPTSRSVYDYLRDHLGYHLVASNYKMVDVTGSDGIVKTKVDFTITNYGMGAPLNLDAMQVVVKNVKTGKTTTVKPTVYNPKSLTTNGQISFTFTFQGKIQDNYSIGVQIYKAKRNGKSLYAKFANNMAYINGTNYIYNYQA